MLKNWPETPRKLLETRYDAFVNGDIDFIVESHHPDTRAQLDRDSVASWSKESRWKGLEVESENVSGDKALITFSVRYEKNFETITQRENAEFRRHEGKWFYFDSEFPKSAAVRRDREKVGRNDPCPCGSGQKFKKCCEKTAA